MNSDDPDGWNLF